LRINKTIPGEYRKIADALFPPEGLLPDQGPRVEAAAAFAEILGIGADYKRLLGSNDAEINIHKFLGHFQNNLDLLIQKTWVEQAEESRKERLQNQVPGFIAGIEQGDYQRALFNFSTILEELAYLFFGAQSQKEDFTEYTFRIDMQMGLFWWYGGQIGHLQSVRSGANLNGANLNGTNPNGANPMDKESLKAILLLGICYLTNF
jgi:hypothetical protein